ncbi:MAG: hypothetical protein ACLUL2_02345 [Blautia sp.]
MKNNEQRKKESLLWSDVLSLPVSGYVGTVRILSAYRNQVGIAH